MSAITIDGDLVHYEVLGRGRPVVLIHGWLGSWRYWVPTMQQLQSKFRVYALDLFGFGDSSKNPQKYSIEHQLQMLYEFTEEMGIPKSAMIGHGLGALLAAEFARRFPDRAPRLMLLSAPLFDTGDLTARAPAARKIMTSTTRTSTTAQGYTPDSPTILSPSSAMRAALAASMAAYSQGRPTESSAAMGPTLRRYEAPVFNPLSSLFSDYPPQTLLSRCFRRGEPLFEKLAVDVEKIDPQALMTGVETFDAGPMLDTLWLLPMPTLVLHGANDRLMEPPTDEILRYVTQDKENLLIPPALPNLGHFPMLEEDRFSRVIAEFLEAPDLNRMSRVLADMFFSGKEPWRRRTR